MSAADRLDAGNRPVGLVLFVHRIDHAHRFALTQFRKQGFGVELGVGLYDVVGRPQNRAGGAVVLLQLDDFELRKIHRQALEVVQRRTTPAINRLVVVAHRRETRPLAHQVFQHLVLGGVGVLVFVDQHMAHLGLPALAHLRKLGQQLQGQADQVVKVHTLVSRQTLLVKRHDAGDHPGVVVGRLGGCLRGIEPHVFPQADGPLPLAGGGRIGGAAAVFQDAGHVVRVHDAELRFETQHSAVFAHDAHAQSVEGANQHIFGGAANQLLGPLAHLGGGFVGEGDGGDALGLEPGFDQASDFVRDHPRLARTGTRQHQAGAGDEVHGFELGVVESG